MNFQGPSIPDFDLLTSHAPPLAWEEAKRQAKRSPMIKFKCGAVILDPDGRIIGKGTSHPDVAYSKSHASIHAERHALSSCAHMVLDSCSCILFTYNHKGGGAWTSRPCYSCARLLLRRMVTTVIYPERNWRGDWIVRSEKLSDLVDRAIPPQGRFARHQRIPAPN